MIVQPKKKVLSLLTLMSFFFHGTQMGMSLSEFPGLSFRTMKVCFSHKAIVASEDLENSTQVIWTSFDAFMLLFVISVDWQPLFPSHLLNGKELNDHSFVFHRRKSYRFGMTWGWEKDDRFYFLGKKEKNAYFTFTVVFRHLILLSFTHLVVSNLCDFHSSVEHRLLWLEWPCLLLLSSFKNDTKAP